MKLSLSVRIAETPEKDRITIGLEEFARLAKSSGYQALCLRASAAGVQTPQPELKLLWRMFTKLGLSVSMATTNLDVPLNNDQGPDMLRNIGPHLYAAETVGADLIRVCLKTEDDIAAAAKAADQARQRGLRLAHQCHTNSLFETVDQILDVLGRIDRPNFGLIYEPANLMLCGQSYGANTLRRLAPYLMNVYVQNHRLADDGPVCLPTRVRGDVRYHDIPLWEPGGVDFDVVFAGLRAIDYKGYVTVHQQFGKLMGPEEAAVKSHAFLSKHIAAEMT